MHAMLPHLQTSDFPPITRRPTRTLQANLGYLCNQTCQHCHVNAGPTRTETMGSKTLALIPQVMAARGIDTLDLTGGAPEMNPGFRDLVRAVRGQGGRVINRCNLTILSEPGYDDLAAFLAEQGVEIIASLPCYSAENVDRQRGDGVFERSIAALQRLNALGYGIVGSGLILNLVYNPPSPTLPPDQIKLRAAYRLKLGEHFGICFNDLYALANMPIQRFGSMLVSQGEFAGYMTLLKESFRAAHLNQVMCRETISVDWQGTLFDCDFNQQLRLNMVGTTQTPAGGLHLRDLLDADLAGQPIQGADHCYGCTAGQGSSCGGALSQGGRP